VTTSVCVRRGQRRAEGRKRLARKYIFRLITTFERSERNGERAEPGKNDEI
jgi:hypothetical protein